MSQIVLSDKQIIAALINIILVIAGFTIGVSWFGWWFLVPAILLTIKFSFE